MSNDENIFFLVEKPELDPLEENDIGTGVDTIQGWHALLRDYSALPGQVLHDQAVYLIKKLKDRQSDIQAAYKSGEEDGARKERRQVLEELLKMIAEGK